MRDLRMDEENPGENVKEDPPVAPAPNVSDDIPPLSAEKETDFEPAEAVEPEPWEEEETSGIKNQTNINKVETSGDAQFAETIVNFLKSETSTEVRNFQKKTDSCLVTFDDDEQNFYEFDEKFISENLLAWLEHRIVVLAGLPNIGKTTTALHLSRKLAEIQSPPGKEQLTRRIDPLKTGVKVNLFELVNDSHNYTNTTLVFVDAFGGGSRLKGVFCKSG